MKTNLKVIITVLITLFISSNLIAQDTLKTKNQNKMKNKKNSELKTNLQHGVGFVDADGDGYNDNAPDHDGDGIPNGLDPDYKNLKLKRGFVDLDGDGINDNRGMGKMRGNKNVLQENNSFGKKRIEPQNGNVSGAGNDNGSGNGNKVHKGKGKHK